MALVRLFGGGQIKGSIGGTTYQQGPYGTVMRNRTVPVNPNTGRQVRVRTAMAFCSNEWLNMSSGDRIGWESYAANTPWLNALGDTVILPARQHFLRRATLQYSILQLLAQPIVIDPAPPAAPGLPPTVALTVAADVSASTVIITAETPEPIATESLIVEWTENVPPTRNYYNGPFTRTFVEIGAPTLPTTIATGLTLLLGYQTILRTRYIDASGRTSTALINRTVNVA